LPHIQGREVNVDQNWTFAVFVVVGFMAQIIDGALGMAYGVTSTSFLLSLGIPSITPAIASASVHASEICTTAVSGLSHLRFGNVDKDLLMRLLIPGVIGGVLGAYILSAVSGETIKPFVALYLLIMGLWILIKAIRKAQEREVRTKLIPLGLIGGFFDAIGGGGWGPIVTTTLVARGKNPRLAVGSVNLAEFFVTLSESITFVITIGSALAQQWLIIAGLIVGGVLAAPLAAYICKRLPRRALMMLVGVLIMAVSFRTLYLALR